MVPRFRWISRSACSRFVDIQYNSRHRRPRFKLSLICDIGPTRSALVQVLVPDKFWGSKVCSRWFVSHSRFLLKSSDRTFGRPWNVEVAKRSRLNSPLWSVFSNTTPCVLKYLYSFLRVGPVSYSDSTLSMIPLFKPREALGEDKVVAQNTREKVYKGCSSHLTNQVA